MAPAKRGLILKHFVCGFIDEHWPENRWHDHCFFRQWRTPLKGQGIPQRDFASRSLHHYPTVVLLEPSDHEYHAKPLCLRDRVVMRRGRAVVSRPKRTIWVESLIPDIIEVLQIVWDLTRLAAIAK
jgi:hypothetical protein